LEGLTISLIFRDSFISILIIAIVLFIVIPVSTGLLDILLIVNIATALTILLTTIYIKSPLELSSFPTIVLIATLLRLSLNISSTRLILTNRGNAGNVIRTFGNFVIAGNPVVGLIIFIIIIIVQFVVITKGAERVSEVAARFTLDSMPGKQMAIDADLNAGLINEKQALDRRTEIQREADFYGSMDGASKFVKGDAIAGIIITFINLIGGIVIGVIIAGESLGEAVNVYTLATVGDGLVSQIPALLISTASGIILTRKASTENLNTEIVTQLLSQYVVLFIGGATLMLMVFIPGLPKVPLIIVGSTLLILGYKLYTEKQELALAEARLEQMPPPKQEPEYDITDYIFTDPIMVEFGYSLVPYIDKSQGGKLLDRLVMLRRQLVVEWGIVLPKIRVKDSPSIMPNEYLIKVRGYEVARGEILPDHLLAMAADEVMEEVDGVETEDPAYGIPAIWVDPEEADRAEMFGYTVVDPVSVLATHISKVVVENSHELLGLEEVKELVDALKKKYPALVESIIPDVINLRTLQVILCNLLEDGIKIKNLPIILQTLGDYGRTVGETEELIEYVRRGIKKDICQKYAVNNKLDLLIINPELEQRFTKTYLDQNNGSDILTHEDQQSFVNMAYEEYNMAIDQGLNPVLATTPKLRRIIDQMLKQNNLELGVISVLEVDSRYEINIIGSINI